jgi:putative PIN family toxin of toxin-antitoxin system
MRVVLDANVLISAVISPKGSAASVLLLWEQEQFELIISLPIIEEVYRVLNYPKIKDKYHLTDASINTIIAYLATAITVQPKETLSVIEKDPSDDKYLECALAGEAQYIVSGDTHLLNLGAFRSIVILSPAAFLILFETD